jgi:hypothetical protein
MVCKNRFYWLFMMHLLFSQHSLVAQGDDHLLSSVNSSAWETRPLISPSGKLYFSRSRSQQNTAGKNDEMDVWIADRNGTVSNPGLPVNTRGLDALVNVSEDDQQLFLFSNDNKAPITSFKLVNGEWQYIEKIRIKNFYNLSTFSDIFYSPSEEVILMAVKRNESIGGQDIYVSFKTESEVWSMPISVGKDVNTINDDFAPFLASDGRSLFYCSTREVGEGKSDIYYTYRLDNTWTNWSQPVNLGSSINSQQDEVYVSVTSDFKYIYYDRYYDQDKDRRDIYKSELPPHFGPKEKLPKTQPDSPPTILNTPPPATMLPEASFIQYHIPLRNKITKHISGDFIYTSLYQYQPSLSPKYSGLRSIPAEANGKLLSMLTVNVMFRLWKGNEILISPETQQGEGIGRGEGMGAFPNAIFAFPQEKPYLARAQMRQYFYFDNSWLKKYNFTIGRFIIQDMTDENPYSNDPQCDFLNFSHTMSSAWDAATTAYGYTHGLAQSFVFDKSVVNLIVNTTAEEAGSELTDWDIENAHSINLQYIKKFTLGGKTGKARLLGYYTSYNGGDFDKYYKVTENGRAFYDSLHGYTNKWGGGIDISYDWSANCGLFLRYSADDGLHEDFTYTQADGSLNGGFLLGMDRIHRPDDRFGLCASINTLGAKQQRFLKEGGTGFMVGDGNLNYAPEVAFETFYSINFLRDFFLTFDYQYVLNEGYNADRGNAHFMGVRLSLDLQN